MTATKTKTITYWGSTALLAFVLLSGGIGYLAHQTDVAAGIAQLVPLVLAIVALVSWATRPALRTLGALS